VRETLLEPSATGQKRISCETNWSRWAGLWKTPRPGRKSVDPEFICV